MLSFLFLYNSLFFAISDGSDKPQYRLLDVNQTNNQKHRDIFSPEYLRIPSILSLPFDLSISINGYLEREDMRSLARCCKLNLDSCKRYIRNLVSIKFDYLLNHNESRIKMKHLLNIPFIDSITRNPLLMPIYISSSNRTSSKYIGIDSKTDNAFLSFWMKRINIEHHQWRIITFVFNETHIERIYLTDSSDHASIISPPTVEPFASTANQVKVINEILLNGKIDGLEGQRALWCSHDMWESFMFWSRIRVKFVSAAQYSLRVLCCKMQTENISVIVYATLFYIVLMLIVLNC